MSTGIYGNKWVMDTDLLERVTNSTVTCVFTTQMWKYSILDLWKLFYEYFV